MEVSDRPSRSRLRWLGLALLLVAAACTETGGDTVTAIRSDAPSTAETHGAAATGGACTPLADLPGGDVANAPEQDRDFPWDRAGPAVLEGFDFTQVISGGPPPDGIRPIDTPCFDDVATAGEWLEAHSPVMVVEVDGDRRAYPLAIMTQHEIVNDVIGGEPVVVTYCPLCNSGLAFERTVAPPEGRDDADQVLDFGTSGRLFQSNLVMYDRQTKTLWTQFTGQAVVGEDFLGTELTRIATSLVGWADFAEATPDGLVLSRDSFPGNRIYGRNPYPGYEGAGDGFLFDGPRDDRLPANSRVVGLGTDTDPVAVVLDRLREQRVVDVEIDGDPVTVWWAPGQASALDGAQVDDGADVGSTGAFDPTLPDGTTASFRPAADDGLFVDDQTSSTWNLLGEAVDGELAGSRLQPVPLDDTFWFVWFAFQPDTDILT